jgi:hypothetical protein
MIDNTHHARNQAKENVALCTHAYKKEDPPQFAWCLDCNQQLLRTCLRRHTGKTERKQRRARD